MKQDKFILISYYYDLRSIEHSAEYYLFTCYNSDILIFKFIHSMIFRVVKLKLLLKILFRMLFIVKLIKEQKLCSYFPLRKVLPYYVCIVQKARLWPGLS